MNQSGSEDEFVPKSSALKMTWALENDQLQAKWTVRKPKLLIPDLPKRTPRPEQRVRRRAARAA